MAWHSFYMETNSQLKLITFNNTWQLDRKTIKVGRSGLAKARQALAVNSQRGEQLASIAA